MSSTGKSLFFKLRFSSIPEKLGLSKPMQIFCSNPFKHFEVSEVSQKGEIFLCCPAYLNKSIGNIRYQSVEDIWNGDTAQEIRRSILDGSFKYCNRDRCPFLHTLSGVVSRIDAVKDQDLIAVIENKLVILPYGPREIICSYDKSCNLSCPSCRTEVIVEHQNRQQIQEIQDKIQKEVLKDAYLLYITGSGDPFGGPFFRKWLQTMHKGQMPNLKEIRLHTNAQLWTPEAWERIPKEIQQTVKSAEISIDAANPQQYSINRRGGSFERLLKNLSFISRLRREGPLTSVTISMVVQMNNFREMIEFIGLGKHFGFDIVYFSRLENWGTYSEKEFLSRAIHLSAHPMHSKFVQLLKDPIFGDAIVYLGNLSEFYTR